MVLVEAVVVVVVVVMLAEAVVVTVMIMNAVKLSIFLNFTETVRITKRRDGRTPLDFFRL